MPEYNLKLSHDPAKREIKPPCSIIGCFYIPEVGHLWILFY